MYLDGELNEDMFDEIMQIEESKDQIADDFLANRDKLAKNTQKNQYGHSTYDLKLSSPTNKKIFHQCHSPVSGNSSSQNFKQLEEKFKYVASRAREQSPPPQ